jgi:hypothetical protein
MPYIAGTREVERTFFERLFSFSWFTKWKLVKYYQWVPPAPLRQKPVRPVSEATPVVATTVAATAAVVSENTDLNLLALWAASAATEINQGDSDGDGTE